MLYSVSMDFEQMSGFRHKIDQKIKPLPKKSGKGFENHIRIRQTMGQSVDVHGGYSLCCR